MVSIEKRHNRFTIVVLIIMCILLVTIYSREGDKGIFHRLQRFSLEIVAPLQKGVSSILRPVKDGLGYFFELHNVAEERDSLLQENHELRNQLMEMEELAKENEQLKSMIQVKENQKGWEVLAADVIGSNPDNWKETLQISAGYDDGVSEYMAVLSPDGYLVGRVVLCTPHTSLVQLITDNQSAIGARLQSNGEMGLIKGEGQGEVKLELINQDAEVNRGDLVITSGIGGTCPPGIPIGRIREITERRTDLSRGISIDLEANLTKLERVMVILAPKPLSSPIKLEE
jgi:rod shape-determining protein MreC